MVCNNCFGFQLSREKNSNKGEPQFDVTCTVLDRLLYEHLEINETFEVHPCCDCPLNQKILGFPP